MEKIKLYHGTDYIGLTNILDDGVIDARSGRQTGETKGMNWFFTEMRNNFSRGFAFSIELTQEEFKRYGMHFMSEKTVANYNPILLSDVYFNIEEAFGLPYEDILRIKNIAPKQNPEINEEDLIFLFIEKLHQFPYGIDNESVSINDTVTIQLLKQIFGEDTLKRYYLIENTSHNNLQEHITFTFVNNNTTNKMHNRLLLERIVNRAMTQILNEGRNEIKAKEKTLNVIRQFFDNASWLDNEYVDPQTPDANPDHLTVIEIIEKRLKDSYFHSNIADSVIRLEPIIMNIALGLGFEQNNPDAQKLERLRSIVTYINGAVKKKLRLPIELNKLKLESTTFDTLNELFGSIIDEYEKSEEYAINRRDYTAGPNNNYTIEADVSFERAHEIGNYSCPDSKLCYTQSRSTWDQYTKNGAYSVYILLRDGWKSEPCVHGDNTPYDDYGLSMIFVIIDDDSRLMYSNTRWNHNTNGQGPSNVDQSFTRLQLSELLNMNYFEVFKPSNKFKEAVAVAMQKLRNGEDLRTIFDYVGNFQNGYAKVKLRGKYNFIDTNGKLISPNQWYDLVRKFCNGYAVVIIDKQYNLIDTNGKLITPSQWYDDVYNFDNGYAKVRIGNQYNFIGTNGKLVSPNQWYDEVEDFYDGYAGVRINGQWNFIDIKGKLISPNQWYDWFGNFYDGYAKVRINGQWNFIDTKGKLISPNQWYNRVESFDNGYAKVSIGGQWNYLGTNGELLSPNQWYDWVGEFNNGYAKVKIGELLNLIDANGKLISPYQWYNWVGYFHEGYAEVNIGEQWNFIDANGKLVSPNQWYDYVYNFKDGYAKARIDGHWYNLDTNGNLYDKSGNLIEKPNGNNSTPLTETQIRKCVTSVVRELINEGRNGARNLKFNKIRKND